ncbi:protein kinase [Clostridium sp. JS66]|uniref:protein kinase n=1 Tax=Clostridium sp. JS66 TaxID=3064705 RepID=UPI00298E6921|nr:protein kinase [Clostridium sp. JS66]WPC43833.1 protein kinase [Clostridium sp. JS66]
MIEKNIYKKNPYDLTNCQLLGKGHNGEVYLLPDGKVIKIGLNNKSFTGEYRILEKVNGNRYFPKIMEIGSNYMVRECVHGKILSKHIKKNGMDKNLACKIIDMLKEFEKIKFSKIDVRCKDIFIQEDGELKVIDPKKCYSRQRNFPRHLSKGLYKLKVLDYFMEVLKEYDNRLYRKWSKKINKYIKQREKLSEL